MKDSYFLGLLKGDNRLQSTFEKSKFFAIIAGIFTRILDFFTNVFNKLKGNQSLSFTYVLTPILNQFHRVLAVFMLLIFIIPHHYWQNTYGLLGAVGLVGLYALKVMSQKGEAFSPIPLPMVIMAVAVGVGCLISPDKGDGFRIGLFYVTALLIAYMSICAIKTEKQLREVLWMVWLGLMVTSLYGIYQGIRGVEVSLALTDTTTSGGMPGRVFSTFENPNNYAELIVLLMPFCAALALSTKKIWLRLGILASLALPFGAIVMTLSRSGWLALGVAVVVFLLLYKPLLIVPLVGLGILAIPFLPSTIMRRILTIGSMDDSSNKYRIYIWEGALRIIENYGATGIGLGPVNFGLIYPSFAEQTAINARHAHMLYLQVIIEMGVMGFVGVMWTVLGTMKNAWAAICKKWATPLHKYTAFAVISAMCGIGFMAFVEYVWYYPRVLFTFFFCLGLGWAVINMVKEKNNENNSISVK